MAGIPMSGNASSDLGMGSTFTSQSLLDQLNAALAEQRKKRLQTQKVGSFLNPNLSGSALQDLTGQSMLAQK